MDYPTAGGSSAALKGCATSKQFRRAGVKPAPTKATDLLRGGGAIPARSSRGDKKNTAKTSPHLL
jgi:hypothetical protein